MPYNRTLHQELTDVLNNGLARVAGPQLVDDFTDSSDVAFASLLDGVLDIIKDRLNNGRNSAVVDLLFTPANILMAGRLVEALEERGFYCSDMRHKSEELRADYLTFEAVLLPLKEEAVDGPGVMEAQMHEADVTSAVGATNDITPGTVVKVSSPKGSRRAEQARNALRTAGYDVIADVFHLTNCAIPVLGYREGAPEAERIKRLLIDLFGSARSNLHNPRTDLTPDTYYVHIND